MKDEKKIIIHVDVDSPLRLLDFYKISGKNYSNERLEKFYEKSWERALDFFDHQKIKASFFVVGKELENPAIKKVILRAHLAGHEIENHTWSHPFGLANLQDDQIRKEILLCNNIIKETTGSTPVGFRSPGYSINTRIINLLEELNFSYDSSGFWSVMNPLLKLSQHILFKNGVNNGDFGGVSSSLSHLPYTPHKKNWIHKSSDRRKLTELPLPRTKLLGIPFYNNFNLWAPSVYSDIISLNIHRPVLVYLFHIIEFMDLTDDIPEELSMHPNLKIPLKTKIGRSKKILDRLMKRYISSGTRELVREMAAGNRA